MGSRKKGFIGNQQGAVMVMGLFMAVSLIGSLWFILGIGEAVTLRDRAIEAADHAAFSAATVHARGMNYISALNLIMFALTVIYVGLALIADICLAIGDALGWAAFTPPVCEPFDPLALAGVGDIACEAGAGIAEIGQTYSNILNPVFQGIGGLEEVIQIGMPIAAEGAAVDVVSSYTPFAGAMISASLIPGFSSSSTGIGLPLKTTKNQYLCDRAFNLVKEAVKSVIPSPISSVIGLGLDAIDGVLDFLTTTPTAAGIGCNGGPFKNENVHIINSGGGGGASKDSPKNGSDTMQMYAMVINAQDKEATGSEKRVSMSKNKGTSTEAQTPKKQIYYSQAEYFFDCTKAWTDPECYDDPMKEASFSMSWRARLRRVYAVGFGNQVVGLLTSFALSGGNPVNMFANQLGNNASAQKMADSINKLRNGAGSTFITGTDVGSGLDTALNFLNGGDKPIH
ncbi:MAG TPA: hypothetical protein VNO21_05380 [Polyangiaceae bacterium]|nr:hypothetical protein [Polyangiaceae bacterium]